MKAGLPSLFPFNSYNEYNFQIYSFLYLFTKSNNNLDLKFRLNL